ncbi:carbohydrate-binding module family 13 protein [Daldinia sp. EC12]|nr:carbohydrate-binding module family 13 protein [Daldinia eschscholtzii]OTB14036.1 carbohydrate-binding module family 13 protein [Daldinia sp. EC12]
MLVASLLTLAFAATGFAQAPEGYKTVYITSKVDSKFVLVPKSNTSGSTLVIKTGSQKPEQQWYIKSGSTKIQLAGTQLCLDAGEKSNWKDMANIYIRECSDTADGQKWVAMEDGRIAVEKSSPQECLDLQYMRATENNPVGLYSCAGLGNTGAADKGINWPLTEVTAP